MVLILVLLESKELIVVDPVMLHVVLRLAVQLFVGLEMVSPLTCLSVGQVLVYLVLIGRTVPIRIVLIHIVRVVVLAVVCLRCLLLVLSAESEVLLWVLLAGLLLCLSACVVLCLLVFSIVLCG
jgi:hypothetical protein